MADDIRRIVVKKVAKPYPPSTTLVVYADSNASSADTAKVDARLRADLPSHDFTAIHVLCNNGSILTYDDERRPAMAATPPVCDFGWKAPAFRLPATDGRTYALSDIAGPNGTLIVFICNHCPYVKAVADRIVRDARDLEALGIGTAAICSNDATSHPDDSFENMARFADEHGFPFPYLHDEDQSVARAWDAVCTPDFFGLNADGELQYRGRLDSSGKNAQPDAERELFAAMTQIAETGRGPRDQIPSMGCSIKWKSAA